MPYATLDQLKDRFGVDLLILQTDRSDPPTGEIDADVVDRALADTEAQIDAYLLGRYALPLAEVPPLVTDIALSIAIYKLHVYEPNAKITADYEGALRQLREISAGVIKLALAGAEPTGTGANGARVTDRERPMTEDTLKGYV